MKAASPTGAPRARLGRALRGGPYGSEIAEFTAVNRSGRHTMIHLGKCRLGSGIPGPGAFRHSGDIRAHPNTSGILGNPWDMHPTTRILTTSLFASCLLAAGAGAASAAPAAERTNLVLAIYQEGGAVETTRLSCDPAAGEHQRAQVACGEITAAGGDFTQLSAQEQRFCTFEYAPVTVAAFGTWRGEQVRYVEEFPNRCVMENETGTVFTFQ